MRRRLTRRQKGKRKKQIIMISTICLLFVMAIGYAAFSTSLSLKAKGNIKEKTRIIQAWEETSQTDFHSDFYKQNIVSATFLDNNNVPDNATESWNVSEDKENGKVMAWVILNRSDNTKYDLYIGAPAGVIANEDSSYLFREFRSVVSIEFNNNFDTSNVVNMSQMFNNCTSLVQLDLSSFDTTNVTSMFSMFCMWDNGFPENKLQNIIFGEKFMTNNVTNMSSMFAGLKELRTLDLSNFDTSNVTTMFHMFMNCESLTELNVSSFVTSNVTDMNNMFSDCYKLLKLDLSNFNTSQVTDMTQMFSNCQSLSELNVNNFNTSKVISMDQMFSHCFKITTLDLCSFDTKNVTDMFQMFWNTTGLKQIKVGTNWTSINADIRYMFDGSGVSSVTTGQC